MSTRSRSRSRSPPPSPFARVERLPCPDDVLHVPLAGVVKITIEFDGSQPNRIVQLLTERYPRDPWGRHGGSGGGAGGGSGGGGSAGNNGESSGGGSGGGGSAGAAGAGSGGNAVAATRVLQPQPSTASSCYSDGILSRHTAHRQADSVPIFSIVGAGGPSGAATDGAATDGASAVVDGGDGVAVVDGGDGAAGEADLWPTSGGGATDGGFCVSQSGASGADRCPICGEEMFFEEAVWRCERCEHGAATDGASGADVDRVSCASEQRYGKRQWRLRSDPNVLPLTPVAGSAGSASNAGSAGLPQDGLRMSAQVPEYGIETQNLVDMLATRQQ